MAERLHINTLDVDSLKLGSICNLPSYDSIHTKCPKCSGNYLKYIDNNEYLCTYCKDGIVSNEGDIYLTENRGIIFSIEYEELYYPMVSPEEDIKELLNSNTFKYKTFSFYYINTNNELTLDAPILIKFSKTNTTNKWEFMSIGSVY